MKRYNYRRANGVRERGFTLIEILIAMLVLMIGLLGIFSLFPVSLDRIRSTSEFSEASAISSSVHQSLATGFHNAEDVGTGSTQKTAVTIHHAGVVNRDDGILEKYTFPLPLEPTTSDPVTYWIPCPDESSPCPDYSPTSVDWGKEGTGDTTTATGVYIWQFGQNNDGHNRNDLHDLIDNVQENFDPSFGLDRYSFAVMIRNLDDDIEGLYQVLIRVYRNFIHDPDAWPGGRPVKLKNQVNEHNRLIREYRAMIAR